VIGTVTTPSDRNVIGAHGGPYALYRALAVSSGALNPIARPDLSNTAPAVEIGPFPQWCEPGRIVSLDPWGHRVAQDFQDEIAGGIDIRPTIAVTKARLTIPEFAAAGQNWIEIDGGVARSNSDIAVTKIAVDPVWHLPGIAERFNTGEDKLRRVLDVNVAGLAATMAAFAPAMRAAGAGTLCGIASVAGFRGLPGAGAYSTSKAAAISWLESLRAELHGGHAQERAHVAAEALRRRVVQGVSTSR
jgi:NAD(P)-dependent dehydrogenase (short-subunit alcohol dehydrogenase family)